MLCSEDKVAAGQIPHPSPNSILLKEANNAWASFSLRWKAQRWRRGCFCLNMIGPIGLVDQKNERDSVSTGLSSNSHKVMKTQEMLSRKNESPSHEGHTAQPAPKAVDLDLWNRYWKAYSDGYGGLLDRLVTFFDRSEATPVLWCSVFLGLKEITPRAQQYDQKNNKVLAYVQEHLSKWMYHAARQFGSIEAVEYDGHIAKVQFTVPEAAAAFQLWVSGLSVETFLRAGPNGKGLPSQYGTPSSVSVLEELRIQACLAPRNPTKATAVLNLGYGVLLPTVFVEALLRGLFDATNIVYEPQGEYFVITFKDVRSARLALHALQFSLMEVFNLTLEYDHRASID